MFKTYIVIFIRVFSPLCYHYVPSSNVSREKKLMNKQYSLMWIVENVTILLAIYTFSYFTVENNACF